MILVTRRRIGTAFVVYGVLAAAAGCWGLAAGRPNLLVAERPWLPLTAPWAVVLSTALGLALALVVVVASKALVRRTAWARRLHLDFRAILGPLATRDIAIFALTSGIAEELFFRGAMQPAFGLVTTSLLFGALHLGPAKRFWVWTASAVLMGLAFGALYELTGSLVGPIVAHVLINYENMCFIDAYDPTPVGAAPHRARTVSEPRLVSTRLRAGGRTT